MKAKQIDMNVRLIIVVSLKWMKFLSLVMITRAEFFHFRSRLKKPDAKHRKNWLKMHKHIQLVSYGGGRVVVRVGS